MIIVCISNVVFRDTSQLKGNNCAKRIRMGKKQNLKKNKHIRQPKIILSSYR